MIARVLYICLAAILLMGAVLVTGCTPEPVITTATETLPPETVTTTATETLPPETIIATVTRTTTILPQPTIPNQIAAGITVTEANELIQDNIDNPEFIIIDVRTPEERAVSYIDGSILLDWNAGVFEAEIESFDRCSTYLLY